MSAQVGQGAVPPVDAPTPAGDQPGPRPRRRVLRRVLLALLVVVVVLLVLAGWIAVRATQTVGALTDARDAVGDVQEALDAGDTGALRDALPRIQDAAGRAHDASSDPVWRAAEHLPRAGAQLAAVATVSAALDDVATGALPATTAVTDLLGDGEGLRGPDGRVDLEPLVTAAPDLVAASVVARRAASDVAGIDTDGLVGPLVGPVEQARDGLDEVASALETGAQVATLLPPMLGSEGPRTYLVAALNSAELRTAGGIVGSLAVVRADGGALSLVDQRSTDELRGIPEPVLPLTAEEVAVHGTGLGRFVQNAVMTPDFPRSAELLAARWQADVGGTVDGVVATDPVAVAALLEQVGPVDAPDGTTLDAETLLATLLHDAYLRYPDLEAADRFFADVAAAVFGALASGDGDVRALVEAGAQAADEGRVRVWSAHPQEQERIAATTLGAAFLSGPFEDAAGVFLNDGTAGKLDYYLRPTLTVEELRCSGPDPTATVRLDLAFDPPADVTSYPLNVTGTSGAVPVGSLATSIALYGPQGAPPQGLRTDAGVVGGTAETVAGRPVTVVGSRLDPGGRATYRFEVPVRDGRVDVWTTPTLTSPGAVSAACP
ncbi:DUF4012 domain-containing protein [Cellulomonas fimi]|uniref:DUF4012 domain-containing protein n=1 Tax=Cellulomonas fimi (strain ATCC 484 / DSM 20113 / JCM 1341 / CCUG 24087 / LMG 16345 / NBRC 15513 / NCIMB 8980 / NCTC 7547 / NRS-133) TaxID=590998 RepID=F4GZF3_CELFA|nr:DUF4012 domain-containing protein [Cellulomonas fimi]AEE44874.1 hypothetical protein Celf_0734 [Cellulomonas fimi ATCC 484]NNH08109.1 DUF4012 domain-containing protein [Cellulomonas fimi]VEH27548.1 Uncharacterised protein [Cellulomonas fimi]